MSPRFAVSAAALGVLALSVTGCVPNSSGRASEALTVAITDDSCAVSANTAVAGAVTFTASNTGSDVNEFEILAEDKLRIVGEKENITAGSTVDYVAQLDPGTYYTACKFRQVGAPIGLAEFTVTGESAAVSTDELKLIDTAVANYISYVKSQAGQLIPAVDAFVAAYVAGEDETARELFAVTRSYYERIEPTAEAFGDLDPKIDYREVDAVAEGLDWTGFHRIEKDLWVPSADALNSDGTSAWLDWAPSTEAQRATFGQQLINNAQELYDLVSADDFTVSLADISNGAIGLLDEVAAGKITGEEDWWSGTDLSDFAANVQGAEVAFGNVIPVAEASGQEEAALVDDIRTEFDAMKALLAEFGSIEDGFIHYRDLSTQDKKGLSDQINALSEPLSNLTHAVLGVS